MRYISRYIFGFCLFTCLLVSNMAFGDAITMADLPYLCDFEDPNENANWVLNPKIEEIITGNEWVIGEAQAYTGSKSLYVSRDGGLTNIYDTTANNVLIAYRDITLNAGLYDIAYDWIGMGNSKHGYLKIVYANRPTSSIKCLGNGEEPTWVNDTVNTIRLTGKKDSLNNEDSWRHVEAQIEIPASQANKSTTRIFFVWVSSNKTTPAPTSVAIDNFQLAKASATDYPTNIRVSATLNGATITWDGSADKYEVMYRKKSEVEFTSVTADANSVTLNDVDYGAYEFWIRGVNGADKTVYVIFPTVFIYSTDCFDALNMYNATFEYGTWKHKNNVQVDSVVGKEKVDYGPADIRSRHTAHFDKEEIDQHTIYTKNGITYGLHTVPNGEFGSVRLGNWETGSEYESISFRYTVESNSRSVLLINYAMVLENPEHESVDQPRFTLDVSDANGNSIDLKCAKVDFHALTKEEQQDPKKKALWHENTSRDGHAINWQEWNTIGISLTDYIGQTLTVKFTSYDCDQGGHFGYAYFTLKCSRSDVDGLPWGEGSTTQYFTAPEGFNYAWFNREDLSDTIWTERIYLVQESDTNTYLCHATYPSNPDCGFWFDASAKPHNPKAELDWKWVPNDCSNGFVLHNRCHVMLTNQLTGEIEHRYDKHLDECYLILENGTEQPIGYDEEGIYVPMPDEGDTLRYGIRTGVYVNDQLFADTAWYDIVIPAIGPLETHLYDSICRGESIFFPAGSQNRYAETGDYTDSLKSIVTGCDSTVIMHLLVHEPVYAEIFDTICFGGSYDFDGRTLTTTTRQTTVVTSRETGCDSIVTLNLMVAPRPRTQLADKHLCGDQQLVVLTQHSDYADSIRVVVTGTLDTVAPFNREPDAETRIPISNHEAGERKAIVYTYMPWCDQQFTDTLTFDVSLSASVVEARFNNVLAFLNADYNGGLEFSAFQWYANGELIPGATGSWYYETTMDPDKEYMVEVTMEDGSHVWTCPFTYNSLKRTQAVNLVDVGSDQRKILRGGQLIIHCNGREYNAQGKLLR